jgi:hypothetical protein
MYFVKYINFLYTTCLILLCRPLKNYFFHILGQDKSSLCFNNCLCVPYISRQDKKSHIYIPYLNKYRFHHVHVYVIFEKQNQIEGTREKEIDKLEITQEHGIPYFVCAKDFNGKKIQVEYRKEKILEYLQYEIPKLEDIQSKIDSLNES